MDQNNQKPPFPGLPGAGPPRQFTGIPNAFMSTYQALQMQTNFQNQLLLGAMNMYSQMNGAQNLDPSLFIAQMAPALQNFGVTQQAQPTVPQEPEPVPSPEVDILKTTPERPSQSSSVKSTQLDMDYDEGHEDVDEMFRLPDDQVESGRETATAVVLSPVAFTPPDSPEQQMSFDELFGITSKPKTAEKPKAPAPKQKEKDFSSFTKPKKVPIYKQQATLMSLEAREAEKKKDPNYDVFDFQDDDDFGSPELMAKPRKSHSPRKAAPRKVEVKSVYVTGVGFEFEGNGATQNKWWQARNTVATVTQEGKNDKSYLSLADQIRAQRDLEMTCGFIKSMQLSSTECSKNQRIVSKDTPILPKFVIKMTQLDTPKLRVKRRKAKDLSDDDEEWLESTTTKSRVLKSYSLQESDRRPMITTPPGLPKTEKARLSLFGPAENLQPKQSFVVCKPDLLMENCPIWRMDSYSLLQKLVPFQNPKTGKLEYRSCSSYSAWCDQISSQYFRISVRTIKKWRSDFSVELEIPLTELFCATSMEAFRHPATFKDPESKIIGVVENLSKGSRQDALKILLEACLVQVFSKNYVKVLREKKDWTFTRSLVEIDSNNLASEKSINSHIPIKMKHRYWIGTYTRLVVSDSAYYSLTDCQVCKCRKSSKLLQFFDTTSYNLDLIVEDLVEDIGDEAEPPVADVISCERCSEALEALHKMHHLKFHMLRVCQAKLEELGTGEVDYSIDKLVGTAKSDKEWMDSVIQGYCAVWDRVKKDLRN